jgi:SpoVK/Ycf46/Vps4 family AAA+-type ATPase
MVEFPAQWFEVETIDQMCLPTNIRFKIAARFMRSGRSGDSMYMCGPPGVGKTLAVKLCAKEYNLELIHINASLNTSVDSLRTIVADTFTGVSLTDKTSVLFFDECEALKQSNPAHTRKMTEFIKDLLENARVPVIFASNSDKDTPEIIKKGTNLSLKMKPQSESAIYFWVKNILDKYMWKIFNYDTFKREDYDKLMNEVKHLCARSKGDMRWLIASLTDGIAYDDIGEDNEPTIYDVVRWIFNVRDRAALADKLEEVLDREVNNISPYLILQWVEENCTRPLRTSPNRLINLQLLARASKCLDSNSTFANLMAAFTAKPIKNLSVPYIFEYERIRRAGKKQKKKESTKKPVKKKEKKAGKKETPAETTGGLLSWM